MTIHQTNSININQNLESSDQCDLYHDLLLHMQIETFQGGDIIIKQGGINRHVYFIVDGLCEVIFEKSDYDYYDIETTTKFKSQRSEIYKDVFDTSPKHTRMCIKLIFIGSPMVRGYTRRSDNGFSDILLNRDKMDSKLIADRQYSGNSLLHFILRIY